MQELTYPETTPNKTTDFLKTPPFSKEAEQSVLGGLMLSNEAWIAIADLLIEQDFYQREHQFIFQAIKTLAEEGYPCDPITLSEWLERNNKLEASGGNSYLGLLARNTPSAANIVAYAEIVREHSILRQLMQVGTDIVESTFNTQGRTSAQILDNAERKVFEIAELGARNQGGFVKIKDVLGDTLNRMEKLSKQQGLITGIPSGFVDLDELISGLQRSDLIIIAGRPSMGKCLAGHVQIMASTGQLMTIAEIYQHRHIQLLTLGTDQQFHLTQPSAFVKDGIKPVFRLTTRLGRTIETTLTHPYLTADGWKPLAYLVIGTKIALPRRITVFGTTRLPETEIELIAWLLGTARCSHRSQLMSCANDIVVNWLAKINVTHSDKITVTALANSIIRFILLFHCQFILWLQQLELWNNESGLIPTLVFTLQRSQLAWFLNRLFTYNGWLKQVNNHWQLGYQFSNEVLARQVQHLLLRFGVIASLQSKSLGWQLTIEQPDSIQTFIKEMGLSNHHVLPLYFTHYSATQSNPESIYWDEITAIEFRGFQPVYDLTIPETHNFVANDICVHNTSFAMNIAEHVALRNQLPVAVFSMEMSNEQLAMRLISSVARINLQKVRTGNLNDDDWDQVTAALSQLQEAPLFIDDTPALNPTELRARVRRLARERGELGLVVIDYLQLMQVPNNKENRAVEVSEISRSLKALAKELNVPVIALSQLNRSLEQRPNKRPRMSDLRESGCLAGDSLVNLTDTGQTVPIQELNGQTQFTVWGLNTQTMRLEPAVVSRAFCTGIKPVFRLTTRLGYTIRATANHPFYTPTGWQRLDQLDTSDYLAISNRGIGYEQQKLSDDIAWDEIVAIVPAGEEAVFDLTVPSVHNFIANNLVLHNSIEQDSDLIIFIYRDEVYKEREGVYKDNDNHNHNDTAEVIIAKQRNGPIGTILLTFLGHYTQFTNHCPEAAVEHRK